MNDAYTAVREVVMDASRAGQRLDNFLFAMFREVPRSRIYSMLRKGEVRVNGGRSKQHYRIKDGDKIRLPPVKLTQRDDAEAQQVPKRMIEQIKASVIHEDEDLLVLNKPEGIAVHSGSGVKSGVIEALRQIYPEGTFLELVHRLDRGTSGVLLIARNRPALTALHQLIRDGGLNKRYLALIAGQWKGGQRRVEHKLERQHQKGKVRHTKVSEEGKDAVAIFSPEQRFTDATLMEVELITGRTHQIRVQSAEQGHPLLGDEKYGDFGLNRQWKKLGLKRMFLHAATLSFRWPESGKLMQLEAPLPLPLTDLLEKLQ